MCKIYLNLEPITLCKFSIAVSSKRSALCLQCAKSCSLIQLRGNMRDDYSKDWTCPKSDSKGIERNISYTGCCYL